ncbi:hypothetical protein [Fimbriiglobus ruber]|uniref:Uncharacterized protein n=1 Tax=Fimbriiglobus ruber TaxID=1908690 RepID=A0A225EFM9_9BACT|nr:hypothetical protein [Fimbriiglobus ruber]OWK47047.1 hypothetical protein FRUB_00746 [Fimbriiglobus ruber]
MTDGPNDAPAFPFRKAFLWTEIFRSFQVALDPRKLLVAAAGILVMSLGWYLLSCAFYYKKPLESDENYSNKYLERTLDKKADGSGYTDEEKAAARKQMYERDVAEWKVMYDLAGPDGRLRTLPWYEYRGRNPFLLFTTLVGGTSVDIHDAASEFLSGTVPVLVEPLRKFLLPVVKLLDPHANTTTRIYLLLALAWSVAVWAFFGGIITRIAAVQFAGKERTTLPQAARFVASRYSSYALSPLIPLGVVAVIVAVMAVYGFLGLIPVVGDFVLYGIGMPLVVLGGIAIAVLLVGLVGYPLMYTTLSAEGSDKFDALSRSYNYVFQAPWSFCWYSIVAILYGAVVTLFVVFMGSLAVYTGKWAISQAPLSESVGRKPDYLFIYAPESFGWKEVLLSGSPLEQKADPITDQENGRKRIVYTDANPAAAAPYRESIWKIEKIGAGMVSFWLVAVFLLVIGFSYSYFWSAATMVYLLMRKKVDETEIDEIYIEEDFPEVPIAPPPAGTPTHTTPPATGPFPIPLPTVSAPATPAVVPPVVVPPVVPPPPAISPPPAPSAVTPPANGTHLPPTLPAPPPAVHSADDHADHSAGGISIEDEPKKDGGSSLR